MPVTTKPKLASNGLHRRAMGLMLRNPTETTIDPGKKERLESRSFLLLAQLL
jgi:hypothetical protein